MSTTTNINYSDTDGSVLSESEFEPFKNKCIRIIKASNVDKSNSWFKQIEEYVKSVGAHGLSYIKVNEDKSFKSSIDKYLNDNIRASLIKEYKLEANDVLFIIADEPKKTPKLAGLLRTKLGKELDLIDNEIKLKEIFAFKQKGLTDNGEVDGTYIKYNFIPKIYKKIKSKGINTIEDIFE